ELQYRSRPVLEVGGDHDGGVALVLEGLTEAQAPPRRQLRHQAGQRVEPRHPLRVPLGEAPDALGYEAAARAHRRLNSLSLPSATCTDSGPSCGASSRPPPPAPPPSSPPPRSSRAATRWCAWATWSTTRTSAPTRTPSGRSPTTRRTPTT